MLTTANAVPKAEASPVRETAEELSLAAAITIDTPSPKILRPSTPTKFASIGSPQSPIVSGTFGSLRRTFNWRQSVRIFKDKVADMTRHKQEAKAAGKRELQAYYAEQISQAEAYIDNDERQRKASVHPDDERDAEDTADEGGEPVIRLDVENENAAAAEDEDSSLITLVTRGSLALNILLFFMKIVLVIRSGSMAFVASLVDSALDLFSGAVMVMVAYAITHAKYENYPTGKHKFESIGTLVFACAMFIASAKIIEQCSYSLADIDRVSISMETVDYFFIAFVIVSKGAAHLLCKRCAASSTTIEALADDHRNDVLTNSCAVLAVFAARYVSRYFDPAIGMATAFFMMFNWACTAYEQATALSGATADPAYINTLTMIARNHDPRVLAVDTVRAVTSGSGHLVEIDLLLPENMPLIETHDIGERLQVFLENCEELEIARAYVHLDYETAHNPAEHR